MKPLTILICMLCLLPLAACAIGNPWLDLTYEDFTARTGVTLCIPEEAADIVYRLLPEMALAEIQYTQGPWRVVLRAMPSEAWEDISGMYFAPWDTEEPCVIAGADGVICRDAAGPVSLCLWYDGAHMYAFSVLGGGADSADAVGMAEAACQGELPEIE